jgi:hypothetical protein
LFTEKVTDFVRVGSIVLYQFEQKVPIVTKGTVALQHTA